MTRDNHSPDDVRDLIQAAGTPEPLPQGDLTRIRAAAKRTWRETTSANHSSTPVLEGPFIRERGPMSTNYRTYFAVAATLLVALAAGWFTISSQQASPPIVVASAELLSGEVLVDGERLVGSDLVADATIETGPSPVRVALRTSSGHSLRVDSNTRLRLLAGDRVELESGAIYIDSGSRGGVSTLDVVTAMGVVREVGTQYSVRLDPDRTDRLEVSVREGSVTLTQDGAVHQAALGERMTVLNNGSVERAQVSAYDKSWIWVAESAPGPVIDGRPLEPFLSWVSREMGLQIEFADQRLELSILGITTHGTVEGLTPAEALDIVLPSSGLSYKVDDGVLTITSGSGFQPLSG